MNKSRHNFTLLEILVAVAVLVIMMSFLFQFVISAQRVWAASTARTYMADQANAVFQVMAEDFNQMITVSEDEDADSVMGWLCKPDPQHANPGDFERLCFYAADRDDADGAYYGVMYYYEPYDEDHPDTTGLLYRIRTKKPVWQKVGETDTPTSYKDFGFPEDTDGSPAEIADKYGDEAMDYLVSDNVTEFIVQAAGPAGNTALPKFFRVTMKVHIPPELANATSSGQEMERTFSRVFFLASGK